MATEYVSGLFGTQDLDSEQRPQDWDPVIHAFAPRGTAPLRALLSAIPTSPIVDPYFNWSERITPTQDGTVTDIFTDILSTSYTSGGSAGDVLYVQMSSDDVSQLRVGHQVLLMDASDGTNRHNCRLTGIVNNGANSYFECILLEDDDNGTGTDLSDADGFIVVGAIQSEGSESPDSLARKPTWFINYAQIMWETYKITGTQLETELRTNPNALAERQEETFERYLIQQEKNLFFGVKSLATGSNDEEVRTMDGIVTAIQANTSNSFDYVSDANFDSFTWVQGGKTWLEDNLEVISRFGNARKTAFVGSGAMKGLNRLADTFGDVNIVPTQNEFGMDIRQWIGTNVTMDIIIHPLFSQTAHWRNWMVVLELDKLKFRPLRGRDTMFLADPNRNKGGATALDGIVEGWRTEATLQYALLDAMGVFTGVGENNPI